MYKAVFPPGNSGRVACAAWQSHVSKVELEPEQVLEWSGASVLEVRGSGFVLEAAPSKEQTLC